MKRLFQRGMRWQWIGWSFRARLPKRLQAEPPIRVFREEVTSLEDNADGAKCDDSGDGATDVGRAERGD